MPTPALPTVPPYPFPNLLFRWVQQFLASSSADGISAKGGRSSQTIRGKNSLRLVERGQAGG